MRRGQISPWLGGKRDEDHSTEPAVEGAVGENHRRAHLAHLRGVGITQIHPHGRAAFHARRRFGWGASASGAPSLVVELADGRSISAPLAWYPRLFHGTVAEREHSSFIAGGEGIHWPDLDEDISIEGIVAGRPSGESPRSLQRWLKSRYDRNT